MTKQEQRDTERELSGSWHKKKGGKEKKKETVEDWTTNQPSFVWHSHPATNDQDQHTHNNYTQERRREAFAVDRRRAYSLRNSQLKWPNWKVSPPCSKSTISIPHTHTHETKPKTWKDFFFFFFFPDLFSYEPCVFSQHNSRGRPAYSSNDSGFRIALDPARTRRDVLQQDPVRPSRDLEREKRWRCKNNALRPAKLILAARVECFSCVCLFPPVLFLKHNIL